MSRFVIALFEKPFPQPFPEHWKAVWRSHLGQVLAWITGLFLFVMPWFSIPHWRDPFELPKVLFGVGCMSVWIVIRVAEAFLAEQDALRRWSAFPLWIKLMAFLGLGPVVFSAHPALSWLGSGVRATTSYITLLVALWVVVAVRDSVKRTPGLARVFWRAWLVGMLVASAASLWLFAKPSLELLLLIPVIVLVGLRFLGTHSILTMPLTPGLLIWHRASHAFLAFCLLDLVIVGLAAPLLGFWMIALVGVLAALPLLFAKRQHLSLAGFLSLVVLVASIAGLSQTVRADLEAPRWLSRIQSMLQLGSAAEVLPNQTLTWQVTRKAMSDTPLFGTGPGDWAYTFDRYRPFLLNQTPLWDLRFSQGGSALAMWLTEYGMVPMLVLALFVLVVILAALRQARQSKDVEAVWDVLLVLAMLAFGLFHPMGVATVYSAAFFVACLVARVFTRDVFTFPPVFMTWAKYISYVGGLLIAIGFFVFALQRAAAAELLTRRAVYTLPLAVRLNGADDSSLAVLARRLLGEAKQAYEMQDVRTAQERAAAAAAELDRALARNPHDAEHWYLGFQIASFQASFDPTAQARALTYATRMDERRPTDPAASLATFSIYRAQMAEEARWVEQSQGREQEEAVQREVLARSNATTALTEALRRKSDYAPALYAQAAWLAQLGKTEEAAHVLEALVHVTPGELPDPEVVLPLALLYRRLNQPDKAVDYLVSLAERFPNTLEYQWQLARAAIQAKRLDEATALLQRLAARAPQEPRYQAELREVLRERAKLAPAPVIVPAAASTTTTTTVPILTPRKRPVPKKSATRPTV